MNCGTSCATEGFLSLAAPRELGGAGLSFLQWMGLMEVFSRSHASVRMIVHVLNGTWRAMNPFADEVQRQKFVVPAVAGESVVAFTLTEPANGSGVDITSSVRRDGDTYYLTGSKHLITFGVRCDYWLLFARLEGSYRPGRHRGAAGRPQYPGRRGGRYVQDHGSARHRPRFADVHERTRSGREPAGRRRRRPGSGPGRFPHPQPRSPWP